MATIISSLALPWRGWGGGGDSNLETPATHATHGSQAGAGSYRKYLCNARLNIDRDRESCVITNTAAMYAPQPRLCLSTTGVPRS